ncbi:FtsX-like permease family protein [Rhodanobacter sp. KK11]|jgi:putative ABC transport system permease protein|uniref:ABC transporter permease n=1 Tax=Rhodanobacter sp. KK11 TaxID=3083255 RepID=UPI002966D225|nr:FtsX-like permease family protein [Rhodanobacter sp. KK11]MDW2980492.1 FtsX-like permease family protein [Rhodanobacter sp. KK11]
MHFRHILSALGRHRIAVGLLVLEIAFSCAVVCNALFLIGERLERMQRPTGVDEAHVVEMFIGSVTPGTAGAVMAQTRTDLAALRAIPGVANVSVVNQTLFGNSFSSSGVSLSDEAEAPSTPVTQYMGDAQLADTLGLKLVDGQWFKPDEFITKAQLENGSSGLPVIISRALADHFFPGQSAVGKTIHAFGTNRVVGVLDRLVQPRDYGPAEHYGYAMLLPVNLPYTEGAYVIRVKDASQRDAVIQAALRALKADGLPRLISPKYAFTLESQRAKYYRNDRAMAWMLVGVCLLLLVVTAVGIVGLTSFWVAQRRRQIGIRRAIGATRGDILRYFQTENFLIATLGIVLGMVLAYGLNLLLMRHYELGRLPGYYLPVGALALWVLGQLAVLGPALRAAAVPPVVATRSA